MNRLDFAFKVDYYESIYSLLGIFFEIIAVYIMKRVSASVLGFKYLNSKSV